MTNVHNLITQVYKPHYTVLNFYFLVLMTRFTSELDVVFKWINH